MPMEALQQYANGSNPQVPPYLALGVLQEKQAMMKRMALDQGAAQGEMPTVKEKVEGASGLMALQQQKQQQAAQQQAMASATNPSPVPAGVQPAESQPETSQGMKRGGLVGLSSGLRLASGGIVAFQEGGSTDSSRALMLDELRRRNPNASYEDLMQMLDQPAMETAPSAPVRPSAPTRAGVAQGLQRPQPLAVPNAPSGTPEELTERYAKASGYGKDFGKGREELMKEMQASYANEKQNRGTEGLIALLAGAGRGYGGQAATYLERQNMNRAADLAEQQRRMDLMKDIEAGRTGIAKDMQANMFGIGDRQMANKSAVDIANLEQETDLFTTEYKAKVQEKSDLLRDATARYGYDRSYETAMQQIAAAEAKNDVQERRATVDAIKAQLVSVSQEMKVLGPMADPEELQALRDAAEGYRKALSTLNAEVPPDVTVKKLD